MKSFLLILSWLIFLSALFSIYSAHAQSVEPELQTLQRTIRGSTREILFIENLGQIGIGLGEEKTAVLFSARSQGVDSHITRTGMTLLFRGSPSFESCIEAGSRDLTAMNNPEGRDQKTSCCRLDIEFSGMNRDFEIIKDLPVDQRFYFYTAAHPDGLSPDAYRRITLKNIYDGIDLVYHVKEGKMKYDFRVKAGADPGQIKMRFSGMLDLCLDREGCVVATTTLGEMREGKPYTYLAESGRMVESAFKVDGPLVAFDIADYDHSEDLVIDPFRRWAIYYGGEELDRGMSLCTDRMGNLYVTGYAESLDYPTFACPGAYNQTVYGGGYSDAYILKFNNNGERLWATYYGGSGSDYSRNICIDHSGHLYVSGQTNSPDFPTKTMAGAYNQNTIGGSIDVFLLKFTTSGERLWATYYGGLEYDTSLGLCADPSGCFYVTGATADGAFPLQTLAGAYNQTSFGGGFTDAFLLKFNSDCERLWATLYGGDARDFALGLCTDRSGNLYLAGGTESSDFPLQFLTGAYNQTTQVNKDAFLLKFNGSGERLWSTYYGGEGYDEGTCLCTDREDNLYVAGQTNSSDFPTKRLPGAYHQPFAGHYDGFILKFNRDTERVWATFYGGEDTEAIGGIATDISSNLYAGGMTGSVRYPTKNLPGAYNQSSRKGHFDGHIIMFNASGEREWATYYGGETNTDGVHGVFADIAGNIYFTGETASKYFPKMVSPGAYRQSFGGVVDLFILKFCRRLAADRSILSVGNGGTVNLFLSGSELNAGRLCLVLGSLSGSSPGLPLPNGSNVLPINWDDFTDFMISRLNGPIFSGFLAPLDSEGVGLARFILPPGLNPINIGKVMTYAFCLDGQPDWDYVSNPVEIELVP